MKIPSVHNSGVLGIQRGLDGLERNAADIAQASGGQAEDVLTPLVDSKSHRLQVEASAKVLQAADETLGSLFDAKA